jgi:hypothetical protein
MKYTTSTLVFSFILIAVAVINSLDAHPTGVTNSLLAVIICLLFNGDKK